MKKQGQEHEDVIDLREARTRSTQRNGELTRATGGRHQTPWRAETDKPIVARPALTVDVEESVGDADELRSALFDHSERVIRAQRLKLKPASSDRSLGKSDGSFRERLFKRR